MIKAERSVELQEGALEIMPGGVNSPVRTFKFYPLFVARVGWSRLCDAGRNSYVDHVMSYRADLFGHSPERLVRGISVSLWSGILYGMSSEVEACGNDPKYRGWLGLSTRGRRDAF